MVEPRYRWDFPDVVPPSESALLVAHARGLSTRLTGLLAARGAVSGEDVAAWFADPLDALHDPTLLPDAAIVASRLHAARERGETVLVFGDFDADGLTGLTIMTLALRRFGIAAEPYVPSRLDDGHGLSMGAIERAIEVGATVIVTVDCGTTSAPEIAAAVGRGLDVIVTDHHRVPAVLPPALAIVNPHRPDSVYPDRRLAGSGVAFKVAQLLLAGEPGGPAAALDLTDLATIGSVADVAPVVGENRAIARLGLERMRTAPRPGIAALLERAHIAREAVDLETVAFAIAPRLNAAGRVGEALEAARLLLARDVDEAAAHADALEAANVTRRDLMKIAITEARAAVGGTVDAAVAAVVDVAVASAVLLPGETAETAHTADRPAAPARPAATVIHGSWGVGIVGLVASRLVEDHGRPAVVGADLDGVIRASCRSNGALDLGAALERCGDLFIRFGGHAGAAGFEIETARWDEFRTRFLAIAAETVPPDPRASIAIDLALPAIDVDYALHRELAGLAPCGPGNPDPLVAVLGLVVTRVRAANGGHSQLTLRRDRDVLDGIAFGRPDIAETVHEGDRLDVVARVVSRHFGGLETLQLEIRDVATSGSHPAAAAVLMARGAGQSVPALIS